MDADRARRLAEALGLQENQKCLYEGLTFIGKASYWMYGNRVLEDEKSLIAWLDSPAGEKAVRDKVREEVAHKGFDLESGYCEMLPLRSKRYAHWIKLGPRSYGANGQGINVLCGLVVNDCSTEASAWLAALEFLDDKFTRNSRKN